MEDGVGLAGLANGSGTLRTAWKGPGADGWPADGWQEYPKPAKWGAIAISQ